MNMLEAALGYARRGLRVFPLGVRSKAPAIAKDDGGNGCLDATTDERQIREWWSNPNRNVGIAAGYLSGVIVVDVDGDDGATSRGLWRSIYGDLPTTVQATTARGYHLYFAHPGEQVDLSNSAKRVAPGIDVRVDGGYVVAPPSVHPDGGEYGWALGCAPGEVEFARLPDWLLEKLVKPRQPQQPSAPVTNHFGHTRWGQKALDELCAELATTGPGERNDKLNVTAFRVGQLIAARHLSYGPAKSDVRAAAERCGLPSRETEKTLASGLSAGMDDPNPRDPRPEDLRVSRPRTERYEPEETPAPVDEVLPPAEQPPAYATLTAEETASAALHYLTDPTRAKLPRLGFGLLDDAIGGLPPGTMFTVGGRTGAGKSSLLLGIALRQSGAANGQGLRVGIVSCEDAEWIWGARIMADLRDVPTDEFFKSPPNPEVVGRAVLAVRDARDYGLHFAFPIGKPIKTILGHIDELVRRYGCNVIMVDYLQAITARGQDRYVARTDAAQAIKGLCHERGAALVMASQLKRPETGNPFREPNSMDMKDSGDIENMSEAIVLLWNTSDEENAPALGKVSKLKWGSRKPRFMLSRKPETGRLVGLIDPPAEKHERPDDYSSFVPRGRGYG